MELALVFFTIMYVAGVPQFIEWLNANQNKFYSTGTISRGKQTNENYLVLKFTLVFHCSSKCTVNDYRYDRATP